MAKRLYIIREKFYKRLFLFQDNLKNAFERLYYFSNLIFILGCLAFISILIYDLGFKLENILSPGFYRLYILSFYILFFSKYIQFVLKIIKRKTFAWIYESILFVVSVVLFFSLIFVHLEDKSISISAGKILFVLLINVLLIMSELHKLMRIIISVKISPLLLLAISFLVIILFGSGLLMMPSMHTQPISYFEALFTSTSAVCVTGLVVVNTSTTFTIPGKIVIIILVQIGGLGIMAFTGFFSYAFTGTVSFRDRMMLKDIVSAETLSGIFKLITKIILLTFLIEILGMVVIYMNIGDYVGNRVFFSVFHSISAFCNSGFSSLPTGLATPEIQSNYVLLLTITFLTIFGSIGFPVLIMFYASFKQLFIRVIYKSKRSSFSQNIANSNIGNRIALITSFVLIIVGAFFYFILENSASMKGQSTFFKVIEAFFGSVNARTAGFNVIDFSRWSYPTLFLMMFLMWVGASPGSTGGGIKTTSFAVALQTAYCFIRGKNKVTINYSEIGSDTISRVLVVIILSIIVTFIGFMGLIIFDPAKNPIHLLLETFSAFSTAGMSIADTASLSTPSKVIIMCLMFIGRIGPLTLFPGIFISKRNIYSKFPIRDLTIN